MASEEAVEHVFDPMAPYGVDPVWAAGHALSDFYPSAFWNTTIGSDEVCANGDKNSVDVSCPPRLSALRNRKS